jgi:hypothetical protein
MNDLMKSDLKMSSLNIRTTYHIYYFTWRSMLISFWIDAPGMDPGGAPPPIKLQKIWFFGVKSWFFTRKIPTTFAPPSAQPNFFKSAPSSLKSWIRPWYWPQYVHFQCHSRRWIQNWSVWDIFFKWLKLC